MRPGLVPLAALRLGLLLAVASLGWPAEVAAQRVTLTLQPTSITFASADPDTTPSVAAQSILITYRVQQNQGGTWRLTALASGDLIAGPVSIDISNVSWAAAPTPPFQAGTLSKTVSQTVASGSGNANPAQTGTLIFRLVNSWTYSAALYTQTITFTLSAP